MKAFYLTTMIVVFLSFSTNEIQSQTTKQVKQMAYADSLRLVKIFKDIHQNPELGFMEVRTSGIIAKELKSLGYEVITSIGKTGVVGILKNGEGPVVMYRADMDCLPVKEVTGLSYASNKTIIKEDGTEVPLMHACGHDAHIIWMLGVAKIMAALKHEWEGTLVFVAQPAEELVQGAKAMIDDKMYEKGVPFPDYLLGLHTYPFPVGTIQNGIGERLAGGNGLDVTFFGIGGHGAAPELAKDPIIMASSAVLQYQTIISRNISPQDAAVITVGAFQSGTAGNIIPPSALLKITTRWFNEKTKTTIMDGIKNINDGIAVANNLPKELYPKITITGSVDAVVNNEGMVNKINKALSNVIDPNSIISNAPAMMGSEDFSALCVQNSKIVYDYIFVGIANVEMSRKAKQEGKEYPFMNHNGNFEVDLTAIPLGTTIGTIALLEMFKK
jgi:hippurate hydrolase